MKRILISTVLSLILLPSVFAADNTELLDQDTSQIATPSFSYTTFGSCSEFESTMKRILPKTNGGYYGRGGGIMYATEDALKSSVPTASPGIVAEKATASPEPYSTTNTQVLGVDEADTVKTDGKYLYSFQENDHVIAILDAKTLVKIKSIRIPTTYYGVTFYLTKNKLIVTATKSNPYSARWYGWYDNEQKSIVALYDISNPLQASLSRVIQVDGSLSDSRVADDGMMTVVVSTSYWTPPIYRMYSQTDMDSKSLDYSSRTLIPRISDMVLTTKGAYKTTARTVADCSRMGSILPDAKSLDAFSFSPTLTSILRFDTSVPAGLITSQVVLSEAGQIHLSKQSIYLTSNMWLPRQTPCPKGAMCMMPLWYNPGTSTTLVHRFAFAGINTNYVYSKSIPGSPLSQYSMDEDGSRNFRIVTSESGDKQSTRVSILDPK